MTYLSLLMIVLSAAIAVSAERCYVCANADSDEDCNSRNITCDTELNEVCLTATRDENGISNLHKSCKQKTACVNLLRQNEYFCGRGRDVAVCFRCCDGDLCNKIVDWPELEDKIARRKSAAFTWLKSAAIVRPPPLPLQPEPQLSETAKRIKKYRLKKKVSKPRRNLKKSGASIQTQDIQQTDPWNERLQSLRRKPVYVDRSEEPEQLLFASEQSNMGTATVMMMSAAPLSCGIPRMTGVAFYKLGTWPTGASFLIQITDTFTATYGWSLLVVFPLALPASCTISTWTSQVFQETANRQAFLLENQPYNADISYYPEFNVTFILQNCPDGFTASVNGGVTGYYDYSLSGGQCVRQSVPVTTTLGSTAATTTATTIAQATTAAATTTTTAAAATTTTAGATTTQATTAATTAPTTAAATTTQPAAATTTQATTAASTTTQPAAATTTQATISAATTIGAPGTPPTTASAAFCAPQSLGGYTLLGPAYPGFSRDIRIHAYITLSNFFSAQSPPPTDWTIKLVFNVPVVTLLTWEVTLSNKSMDGRVFLLRPLAWYNVLVDRQFFDVIISYNSGLVVPVAAVYYCSGLNVDLVIPPGVQYPYGATAASGSVINPFPMPPTTSVEVGPPPQATQVVMIPQPNRCNETRGLLPPISMPAVVNFIPSPASDNLRYDYNEILHKSILFYEAQRSGSLPPDNRALWRGDSNLHDGCAEGVDLSGGWHDGAENVKYGFPLAATVTTLAWGMVEFEDGYKDANEWRNALKMLKWGTDYLLNAHTAPNQLWGQVGDPIIDQTYWTRPEELKTPRPAFQINKTAPGSDLAGETAAALAAAAIVFQNEDLAYSDILLTHALQLYEFANTYRGFYDSSIPSANRIYPSISGFGDELAWAAMWLYRATGDSAMLEDARQKLWQFGLVRRPYDFSWDNKLAGVQVLLAAFSNDTKFRGDVENFLNHCLTESSVPRTPGGLAFFSSFGTNSYAANAALIALVAVAKIDNMTNAERYFDFAKTQIHALLGSGDGGRSYVIGFGNNPPTQPYHAPSSCPQWSEPFPPVCNRSAFELTTDNPHILYGALVGGPDKAGNYKYDRREFINNEVSINYNAGFQSAIAGLKHFVVKNRIS